MARTSPPRALLLDAARTLLQPARPVALTYAQAAARHGVTVDPRQVARGFRQAFGRPWPGELRYQGDGRDFWKVVVAEATGSDSPGLFEELYAHYGQPSAWTPDPGLVGLLRELPSHEVARGLVSNWDLRLRPLLEGLGLVEFLDSIVISAEVGMEKPDPGIFALACEQLEVEPDRALHVGDSEKADVHGARSAGLQALRWTGKELSVVRDMLL